MTSTPTSTPRLFLSPPHMGGSELDLVREVFASNYIAPVGPMLERFERAFAEVTGTPHCLAVTSGTAALHLALRHLGIGPGDTVVASTLTFIGSVSAAAHLGADLVFVDADTQTWCMDPRLLKQALGDLGRRGITPKAVIPTDLYGQCADLESIRGVCEAYDIPVLVDAAESLGATYRGQPAGRGVWASVYSLNGNKIITSSGGGILASDDADLIAHARKLATQAREAVPHYEHTEIGYNYRMSNVVAAIGLGQLRVLPERVAQRRQIREWYEAALADIPAIGFMPKANYGESNGWLTVITLDPQRTAATPETVRLALEAENIESRSTWKPMHCQPVFAGRTTYGGAVSERIFATGLCLPSGSAMTEADVDRVATLVRERVG